MCLNYHIDMPDKIGSFVSGAASPLMVKSGTRRHFSCTILAQCLKSEIMDGFWSLRCVNDCFDLPNKMGSYVNGAANPLVVKSRTKRLKLSQVDGFWSSRCLNDCIDLPDKIWIWSSRCLNNCLDIRIHMGPK